MDFMKKNIYYCMVLSEEQFDFLAGRKYGIDRMRVLRSLIGAAVIKETKYEKKGFAVTLHIGQTALSEVDLANRLGYDKKTVSRLLDRMSALGIVTSEQTNRTSIHTVHCVSAWYADNQKVLNPYYVSMKERHGNHAEDGNINSNGDGMVSNTDKDEMAKPDTSDETNFHSGSEHTAKGETYNPLIPLGEDGGIIPHAREQPVPSSLISEVPAASGFNDKPSPDAGQGQSDNRPAEEVHPDSYRDFGKAIHFAGRGISEVCVGYVTRIAYVAQNRSALPCHISSLCRSQARNGLVCFNTLYHLYKKVEHDYIHRRREERRAERRG